MVRHGARRKAFHEASTAPRIPVISIWTPITARISLISRVATLIGRGGAYSTTHQPKAVTASFGSVTDKTNAPLEMCTAALHARVPSIP